MRVWIHMIDRSRVMPVLSRLALAALLGLGTTLAVAVSIAVFGGWGAGQAITTHLAPRDSTISSIHIWQIERPGALRRVVVTYGEPMWTSGMNYIPEEAWHDLRIGPDTRFDVSWGRLHEAHVSPANRVEAVEDARGWPLLALSCWYRPGVPADFHGGYPLDGDIYPERPTRVLPLTPMWKGLAGNTALFGAVWAVVLMAPLTAKGWRRARRGLCPRCGYDLLANLDAGCPECGWNRDARP